MQIKSLKRFRFKFPHISLANQILIGAGLGIFTGLFFGDACKVLLPIGNAFTMLFEVVVYPYIISTLLSSLGKLSPQLSWRLLKRGWLIYFLLILLTFGTLYILIRAFPLVTTALQSPTAVPSVTPNLIDLIIPQNLFLALTNNYVPAVILFCILFGVMLQRVKRESSFFRILDTISNACTEYWHVIVKIAPFGVFVLLAYTAGTIRFEQLKSVAEYLLLVLIGVLLLTFWLLPAIITSFTEIRYRTLMKLLKNTLILAVSTKLSILALPYIKDITKNLLEEEHLHPHDATDIIDTVLLIGYPLGQLGNFFVYLFIWFASTYYNHPLTYIQKLLLPLATYLSAIGSPHTTDNAVNFLTSWLQLPNDTGNLFDSLSLITEYGQVLVSVMGFSFLATLITFACCGKLKIQFKKAFTHIIIIAILLITFVWTFRDFIPNPGIKIYQRINNSSVLPDLTQGVKVTMIPPFDETNLKSVAKPEDSLFRIQKTGVLRVGYNPETIPYVFFNYQGQLAGFDVAMMYALAQTLKCKIEFIPFNWAYLNNDLLADKFDIIIGGLYVTSSRLQIASFSEPYLKLPMAFVVPQTNENEFSSADKIRSIPQLRLAVPNDQILIDIATQYLPNANLVPLDNLNAELLSAFQQHRADASLWDQAGAQIWALGHPGYVAVISHGIAAPFLIAYMVQRDSPQFLGFLNYWLELKENDGLKDRIYNKWILGRETEIGQPRWSILRNVLHFRIK